MKEGNKKGKKSGRRKEEGKKSGRRKEERVKRENIERRRENGVKPSVRESRVRGIEEDGENKK